MGRPRKPTELLKLEGGYRADRHGERKMEPQPTGTPQKPDNLSEDASRHWDEIAPGLIETGVATVADGPALVRLCQFWAECCEAERAEPHDRKRLLRMAAAHKEWLVLAVKFGLTPVDRAKIGVGLSEEYDPAAEFLR